MSGAPGIPSQFYVQTANRQNLASWGLSPGATSYELVKSQDNITYSLVATVTGSPLATSYLDTAVTAGNQYWYKVRAVSVDGNSPYTAAQSVVPVPTGEMSLGQIRLQAMQRADRVNSNFVTLPEWRNYINQSMFELYDLLVTTYEDYFIADPILIQTDGATANYTLPNGANTFIDASTLQTVTPKPFYKLKGVDLGINNSASAFVTLSKFNFQDRNKYVYPNNAGSQYGVLNLQYRVMGNQIQFIPTPSASQSIKLWYIPRLTELLRDTDQSDIGISGWIDYVVTKAAYYALTKEESDTTSLVMQLGALQKRIEETAANRDAGSPETIADTSSADRFGDDDGYGGIR